jgi:hypothetical protein
MFDTKRSKRIRVAWAIVSLMVIFSMVIWSVGLAFMQ